MDYGSPMALPAFVKARSSRNSMTRELYHIVGKLSAHSEPGIIIYFHRSRRFDIKWHGFAEFVDAGAIIRNIKPAHSSDMLLIDGRYCFPASPTNAWNIKALICRWFGRMQLIKSTINFREYLIIESAMRAFIGYCQAWKISSPGARILTSAMNTIASNNCGNVNRSCHCDDCRSRFSTLVIAIIEGEGE